jgi:CubicO group peptidase (beta-lactamase class C family)
MYGKRAPAYPPGTRYEYSNYGFMLLGRIVEAVSGQSYDDYVREHIFAPSGMTATGSLPEDTHPPRLSVPYTGTPPALESAFETLPYRGTPAGGGYSTVGDMLKFALALNAHRLLDAKHTELLTTGKVDTASRDTRYAYGFQDVHLANGLHRIGHSGGATGMNGLLAIYPEAHYVLVVLANRDPPAAMEVAALVVKTVILPARTG